MNIFSETGHVLKKHHRLHMLQTMLSQNGIDASSSAAMEQRLAVIILHTHLLNPAFLKGDMWTYRESGGAGYILERAERAWGNHGW